MQNNVTKKNILLKVWFNVEHNFIKKKKKRIDTYTSRNKNISPLKKH